MKAKVVSIFILCMLLVSLCAFGIDFSPEETFDSVVVVYTDTGVGSGFAVKENIIITNAHVVGQDKTVKVNLYDGTALRGTVIKVDEQKDMALIAVDKKLVPLDISTKRSVGDEVYAIGAPKDMPYTMTKGIISAMGRKIGRNEYIQIDASVNSGNSGGPLVNADGEVIGMITLKASDAEGMGFAITAEEIKNFIEGVETPEIAAEGDPPDKVQKPKRNSTHNLATENSTLKVIVAVSCVANVILILLCIYFAGKARPKKQKDEYDFEIEIEE